MAEAKTGGKRADDAGSGNDPAGGNSGKSRPDTKETVDRARGIVASVIWLVAVLAALALAAGALVVALDFNEQNSVVRFLTDTAEKINILGELKSFEAGRSADSQQSALTKTVLVNWGICAVVYLVVGKLLDRLIRP